MNLKEMGCVEVVWFGLTQDSARWWARAVEEMNCRVSNKAGDFLNSYGNTGCS